MLFAPGVHGDRKCISTHTARQLPYQMPGQDEGVLWPSSPGPAPIPSNPLFSVHSSLQVLHH